MTTKVDYTDQEWLLLVEAPIMTGTYIIISDVSMTALPKETRAMLKAAVSGQVPDAAQELVSALTADIRQMGDLNEQMEQASTGSGGDPRADILARINAALAVLDEKAAPEEKAGFCAWLMQIANATAEAGREGGFLGIGSVRVSRKEKAALAELQQAFGLG